MTRRPSSRNIVASIAGLWSSTELCRQRNELTNESYQAPLEEAWTELREKGSRFRALVLPAVDESSAQAALERVVGQHPKASHYCWAWRLGSPARERFSDSGEPAGTAGEPILRTLRGAGVSDALVVVVRWFGGTKLGRGGLARAYGGAASEALSTARLVERAPVVRFEIELPYHRLGAVKRLLHPPQVTVVSADYGRRVRMALAVREAVAGELEAALADLQIEVDRLSAPGVD